MVVRGRQGRALHHPKGVHLMYSPQSRHWWVWGSAVSAPKSFRKHAAALSEYNKQVLRKSRRRARHTSMR